MSLDAIWDDPVSPVKRPRQSLFLSDSDSDNGRPQKRATPASSAPPDVDALFDDLDKNEDEDLRYKPLPPALDVAKLTKEAEERHARARQTQGGPKTGQSGGKEKEKESTKTGRRTMFKLDEERLVGPEGFPRLIEDMKGFRTKGKGHEHADLNRLLQIYQFWTHKMYSKTPFKDTVNRVEKLCHSKRMQVRLSVWRDEFNGITKDKAGVEDVIDLTEPTLVATDKDENEYDIAKSDPASSRPPSLPPTSSEAGDDDFDIDAVIRAEEERLARERTAAERPPSLDDGIPDIDAMDLDEASLSNIVDVSTSRGQPSAPTGNDEDMWDIVDQIEQGQSGQTTKSHIPLSGVSLEPVSGGAQGGNTSRATNYDDWEDLYS